MKSFRTRTLTGFVFVLVMLSSLLHPYAFIVVFMLVHLLCLLEYQNLLVKLNQAGSFLAISVPGILLHGWVLFVSACQLRDTCLLPAILLLVSPWLGEAFPCARKKNKLRWLQMAALAGISLPLSLLAAIVYKGTFTPQYLLALFILVWTYDTGAYLTGSMAGKHKIWPAVSPAKSWEGLAGGILLALVAAFIMHHKLGIFSLEIWFLTAGLVSLMTNAGDFSESWLKREAKVKDSGSLLPGHGGVLDRFDGFLFATPLYFVMMELFIL